MTNTTPPPSVQRLREELIAVALDSSRRYEDLASMLAAVELTTSRRIAIRAAAIAFVVALATCAMMHATGAAAHVPNVDVLSALRHDGRAR